MKNENVLSVLEFKEAELTHYKYVVQNDGKVGDVSLLNGVNTIKFVNMEKITAYCKIEYNDNYILKLTQIDNVKRLPLFNKLNKQILLNTKKINIDQENEIDFVGYGNGISSYTLQNSNMGEYQCFCNCYFAGNILVNLITIENITYFMKIEIKERNRNLIIQKNVNVVLQQDFQNNLEDNQYFLIAQKQIKQNQQELAQYNKDCLKLNNTMDILTNLFIQVLNNNC